MGIEKEKSLRRGSDLQLRFGVLLDIDPTITVQGEDFSTVNSGNPLDVVLFAFLLGIANTDVDLIEGEIGLGTILDRAVLTLDLVKQTIKILLGEVLRRIGDALDQLTSLDGIITGIGQTNEVIVVLTVRRTEHRLELDILQALLVFEVDRADEVVEVDTTLRNVILIHNCCVF